MKSLGLLHLVLGFACLSVLSGTTARTEAAVKGDLQVDVRDVDGNPLPGATVTVRGPAQPGERVAVTTRLGSVRFNMLAPGLYDLGVSMSGYAAVTHEGVPVVLDETRSVSITLSTEWIEDVTVTAEDPLVNVRSTKVGLSLRPELVEGVPTAQSFISRSEMAAGVDPGSDPMVRGARRSDNLYLVDGINTTDPVSGTWGTFVDYEAVQQHDIVTAGHGAEYGSVVGMISNLVTKSGGNQFHGSLFTQIGRRSWASGTDPGAIGSSATDNRDYSATLGGPVVKDRLWWFASYQVYRSDIETVVPEGFAPRPDTESDAERAFGKLTWRISKNHELVGQIASNEETLYNFGASDLVFFEQFQQQIQPQTNAALRHTAVLAPNVVLQSQVSYHRQDRDLVPQYPELGPNVQAVGTQVQFGGPLTRSASDRNRNEFRSDLTWFHPTVHGDHNLGFGVQYSETDYRYAWTFSGNERFVERQSAGDSLWSIYGPGTGLLARWLGFETHNPGWQCRLGGAPCSEQTVGPWEFTDPSHWQMIIDGTVYHPTDLTFDSPSVDDAAADQGWVRYERAATTDVGSVGFVGRRTVALYAQDEWSLKRLALTLGLRLERVEMRDSRGDHFFTLDTTAGPRLGASYDLRGDGRQKIFAHYGRYYDPIRDDLSASAGQYGSPRNESQYWFAPHERYYTWDAKGGPGNAGSVVAPDLKTPYTDMLVLGYAIDFGNEMALEISAHKHRTRDLVDDFDPINGAADPILYPNLSGPTLASLGFSDRTGDGKVDINDIDANFVIYNPPGAVRHYEGLDIVFTKRMARNWQLLASYSYADATGNQPGDSMGTWNIGRDPYSDPRMPYMYGKLDVRDHTLKAYGSYRLPFGLEIGGALVVRSGSHYNVYGTVSPNQRVSFVWDGDPAKIVDTLLIDRDEFSAHLGIPKELDDGSRNRALDQAIVGLIPFDLRAGRGVYENPWYQQFDLRLRYRFGAKGWGTYEVFLDVYNVFNRQKTETRQGLLRTDAGIEITPENITDREIYLFQRPLASQAPRRFQLGLRVSF